MFTAAGKSAAVSAANYIEDVFSTYLYTGVAGGLTITNNIDLSGKGGMVWTKGRNYVVPAAIFDTVRGANQVLRTNSTNAQASPTDALTGFTSSGYTLGADASDWGVNYSPSYNYVSWTFREQPKFFDVVTYTGNGVAGRTVAHNLGSAPGFMIVKRTNTTGDWGTYHVSLGPTRTIWLNLTDAQFTSSTYWNNTAPTATEFTVGANADVNANGSTYVAYLFAHNAGGFGLTGTDNVISCGSYSGSANAQEITLGYEPQWLLVKCINASTSSDWLVVDVMRGMTVGSVVGTYIAPWLLPNSSSTEQTTESLAGPTPTGFILRGNELRYNASGRNYIYIAIRRGPMRTPTSSTTVFTPVARTGTGANATVTGGSGVTDLAIIKNRGAGEIPLWTSRLTANNYLASSSSASEVTAGTTILQANPWDVMDGVKVGTTSAITNASGNTYINYLFDRAPGFFDVVCYTGNGSATQTVSHNLTVPPEMYFFRERAGSSWWLYHSGFSSPAINYYARLNATDAQANAGIPVWGVSNTTFSVSANLGGTTNTAAYIAYLFASCPGVSKVGSYTGTGTTQQINCGFSNGSRFVMIKRVDATGNWYVWDSARGIVAGNDPYFFMNSISNESVGGDLVDTYSLGFEISSTAPAEVNANGGRFIFLAIA